MDALDASAEAPTTDPALPKGQINPDDVRNDPGIPFPEDPAPDEDQPPADDDEPPVETPEDEVVDPLAQPQAIPPGARDYSQVLPEWQLLARKIPNQAFKQLIETTKKVRELEAAAETAKTEAAEAGKLRWYGNENAWQLQPEVREASTQLQKLQSEEQYWLEQFKATRANTNWTLKELDESGKVTETQMQPSVEAEAYILDKMQEAKMLRNQARQSLQSLKTEFEKTSKGVVDMFGQIDKQYFSQVTGPKVDARIKELLPHVPNYLLKTPEMQIIGKSLLIMTYLADKDKAATKVAATRAVVDPANIQSGEQRIAPKPPQPKRAVPGTKPGDDILQALDSYAGR
jgi:hypothetical protein